jgi:hypothetical protein
VGIITAPAAYIQTPAMSARYFYSLCNPVVSLFIFLVLCCKGIEFTFVAILFTVRNLALWSEKPLTMGDVQESLNLALSIKILSMAVHF